MQRCNLRQPTVKLWVIVLDSHSPLNDRELSDGQVVLGKYRISRKVGEGGFGRVYEAEELEGARRVALKVGRGPQHEERMVREARLASLLESPHSVRVLGVERLAGGSPLIVMELLEGISLREYLAMRGYVEPPLALRWARQLAEALREAHSIGLVHRDLKPSNLFLVEVEGSTQLKLLDFGLARGPGRSGEHSVTGSEVVVGSPAYMSPEQIRSGEVSPRSDVWSFGVVLYEMLAGRRPFQAQTNAGLLAVIAADPAEPLEVVCPTLSPEIHRLVERCLRKRPQERFVDVPELIEALEGLRVSDVSRPVHWGEPLTDTRSEPARTGPARGRRSRWGPALAAAISSAAFWSDGSSHEFLAEPSAQAPPRWVGAPLSSCAHSSAEPLPDPPRGRQAGPRTRPALRAQPLAHDPAPPEPAAAAARDPRRPEPEADGPRPLFFAEPDF